QYGERIGSAIDEVAGKPQPIARRREIDQRQELVEFRMTTLDVSDRVERHEKARPGTIRAIVATLLAAPPCSSPSTPRSATPCATTTRRCSCSPARAAARRASSPR